MFYTIFAPTTKSLRETKEFFNFEIRFENYIRVHQKRIIVMSEFYIKQTIQLIAHIIRERHNDNPIVNIIADPYS